jgi:hypothetical protein
MGRFGAAVAEAERHMQTDPLGPNQNFTIGSIFVFGRQWNNAIAQLRSAIDLDPYYWFEGDRDQTFAWLNRAYDERSELLVQYLTTDSRLDHLHSDPRFADLRRRTGLP